MRILLVIFILTSIAKAQDTLFVSADSLKESHISLDEAWKYSPGDNLDWATKEFDDSVWDTLNPKLKWEDYDKLLWKGIGWFRKDILIDSSLLGKSVALTIRHFGSSEIYLNGKKINEYGRVSAIPDSEKVYNSEDIPIALDLDSNAKYVLAVRYSNHNSIEDPEWTDSWFGIHGFTIRIHDINSRIKDVVVNAKTNYGVNLGIAGIFLSLAILYFLLHLFYSKKRENLYYAFFAFSLSMVFAASMATQLIFTSLTWIIIFKIIGITGIALTFLFYLAFTYSIFYKKIPKQIWLFVFGTATLSIMLFFKPVMDLVNYVLPIYILLATMEGFRVIIMAIKKNKEHSWVIGVGVLVFVFLVVTIFVINLFDLHPPGIYILILFLIGLFGLPASMSVYLARNIASTNKKLGQQLIEIKDLSAKELEAQQKNAELILETEREVAAKNEAVLQAKAAELQAKASEAERRILEAENERKTHELEEARNLQLSLLPKRLPDIPGIEISVHMETATEVGGDYYDFYEDANGELTILIGDATGHGLNAGTMVTATKSLFNSHASNPDIVATFKQMSSSLRQMNFKLLSMCLMLLKINGNKLRISSAGMPPALIYRSSLQKVEEFLIRGMPLGTSRSFPYELRETELEKGDTILLMSDGFPELFNEEKKMLGYKSAEKELQKYGVESCEFIIEKFKEVMIKWSGDKPPHDDVTFVVVKIK